MKIANTNRIVQALSPQEKPAGIQYLPPLPSRRFAQDIGQFRPSSVLRGVVRESSPGVEQKL